MVLVVELVLIELRDGSARASGKVVNAINARVNYLMCHFACEGVVNEREKEKLYNFFFFDQKFFVPFHRHFCRCQVLDQWGPKEGISVILSLAVSVSSVLWITKAVKL